VLEEKTRLIKSVQKPGPKEQGEMFLRGQYVSGVSGGKNVPGYRDETGVGRHSCSETFFAAKFFIDNERWKGVPFYMKAGKRLKSKSTKIALIFKDAAGCLFCGNGAGHEKNVLEFEIAPNQGIYLKFNAKSPGSRLCTTPLSMEFNYDSIFGRAGAGDYENIILDCMNGDGTMFWGREAVEEAWRILTPVLRNWESCSIGEKSKMMFEYAAGSRGPEEADEFIKKDGRSWVE
jgi:glucose-6-phosphate 1-dehydrogenase